MLIISQLRQLVAMEQRLWFSRARSQSRRAGASSLVEAEAAINNASTARGLALDAVRDGRADCAMIPIENSLHGRVADIHFLLPQSGLVITGEHFLPIRYALMGLGKRAEVRQAMSHPQALGQCYQWLKTQGISKSLICRKLLKKG
jgi:prephenate dehydratase